MIRINKQNTGFALLMSLIVVSVVISIGLVVLDLTLKQLRLSTNSKDSETAFHAANAAMECARYWRYKSSDEFTTGDSDFGVNCFDETVSLTFDQIDTKQSAGDAYKYSFKMNGSEVDGVSWGYLADDRCSQVDILVVNSNPGATTTVENMPEDVILGYPESEKECEPDGRCTVIAARGYSRSCNQISLPGTVEREVLLEL